MKKNCRRLSALILAVVLLMVALPAPVLAEDAENASPFSNVTCVFDSDASKIKLEYRMKSEDVKKYADCEIELYALSASQSIEDIPSLEPKVTGLSPSNRAGAEVRYEGLYDRLSSYVFVMETDDGLVCSEPMLPRVETSRPDIPFKGIETSSTALAVGMTAETVIVDISTDSLISNGSGYLYSTTGYTYTFSSTYLHEIDDLIMLYRGAGRRILFRLVVGPRTAELYTVGYELQRTVYSCVSFLYSRYEAEKFGGINGLVLDTAERSIPENAESCAQMLYAAAAGLSDAGADCPLVLPIGEDIINMTDFLDSLVAELGESTMFTLMLESRRTPYAVDDNYISMLEDDAEAAKALLNPSNSMSRYISAENLRRLTQLIDREYKSSIYQDIIYHWTPGENVTGEAAVASYVYNYYALTQFGRAASFIISPNGRTENDLIETVKYINTDLRESFIDDGRILDIFDLTSWSRHFNRYDPSKLQTMTVKSKLVQPISPPRFIGTVDYFDFSSSDDVSGWYAGQNCNSIYADNTKFGRSFNAEFDFPFESIPGAAFVSYTYRYSESFKYTDYIAVELSVESEAADVPFDVTISFGGAGFIYEYKAVELPVGAVRTLYLDVREFDESMVTDFLRITVEPHGGNASTAKLCLYSVTANSLTYNSERLENYILSERERLKNDGSESIGDDVRRNATVFLAAILAVTVLVMVMLSRRRRKKLPDEEDQ